MSLMAKTMAVTLPFVLLLLDFWPLRRLGRRALLEKVPLIAMAAIGSILTFLAQRVMAHWLCSGIFHSPFGLRMRSCLT